MLGEDPGLPPCLDQPERVRVRQVVATHEDLAAVFAHEGRIVGQDLGCHVHRGTECGEHIDARDRDVRANPPTAWIRECLLDLLEVRELGPEQLRRRFVA